MATSVYVWLPTNGYVGHASMEVGTEYISFWPADAAGKKDVTFGTTHKPYYPKSHAEDKKSEGNRDSKVVDFFKLNEKTMLKGWKDIKDQEKRYNLKSYNCSTVVSALLASGSGRAYSRKPQVAIDDYVDSDVSRFLIKLFYGSKVDVWTPEHVLEYAKELKVSVG